MNRSRSFFYGAVLAVSTLILALPMTALAARHAPTGISAKAAHQPATGFQFGQKGGNIRPWTVTITSDGSVAATGINVRDSQLQFAGSALTGLNKLVVAEKLNTFPKTTLCPGVLPDVASRFITFQSAGQNRTVTVHGTCKGAFNQMFAVLYAVADVTLSSS